METLGRERPGLEEEEDEEARAGQLLRVPREGMESMYDATANGSGVFHRNNSYESLMNLKDYVEIDLSRYYLSTSDPNPPLSPAGNSFYTASSGMPNGYENNNNNINVNTTMGKKGRYVVTRTARRKKGGGSGGGGVLWEEGSVMGFRVRDIMKILLVAFLVCMAIHLLNCYRFRLEGKWRPAMCPF